MSTRWRIVMSSPNIQEHLLSETNVRVREIWRDAPERGRDFDVEGSWTTLLRELRLDSKEFNCQSYTVLNDGSGLFAVWRMD